MKTTAMLKIEARAALNKMRRIEKEIERDSEKAYRKRHQDVAKRRAYVNRTKAAQDAAFEKVYGKRSPNDEFLSFWK